MIWVNSWFDPGRESEAADTLMSQGADVLTHHTDSTAAVQAAEAKKVYAIAYHSDMSKYGPNAHLTAVTHQWGAYYTKVVQTAIDGKWKPDNVWGGIKDGMIKMAPFNTVVPQGHAGPRQQDRGRHRRRQVPSVHRPDQGQRRQGAPRRRQGDHRRRPVEDGLLRRRRAGQAAEIALLAHARAACPPMSLPTSYLFVPGDRPDRFAKAVAAGAGAVIIDLEDAVAPEAKPAAREHIRAWCQAQPGAGRAFWCASTTRRVHGLMTTSNWCSHVELRARRCCPRPSAPPTSRAAWRSCRATASSCRSSRPRVACSPWTRSLRAPGVQRLAFGTLDYAVEVDLSGDERGLLYPACRMALASKVAGISARRSPE